MKRFLRRPPAAPLAVAAGLAAVLALAHFTLPVAQVAKGAENTEASQAAGARRAPLGRLTTVCPEPSLGKVALGSSAGSGAAGKAVVRTLGGEGSSSDVAAVTRRGTVWTGEVAAGRPAYVVEAQGAMAAGLEVEQVSHTGSGPGQGLSSTRCVRPQTDFWFITDGVRLGRSTRLFLANVDDAPVSVNVDVYGPNGPQPTAAGRGISVPADSRKKIELGGLAPDSPLVALHVHTTSGRVAAALHTRGEQGDVGRGIEWVPQTVTPQKKVVVPGLPAGQGSRRLLVAAPGNRPAEVKVQLVTGKGTYAPKGKDTIHIAAGSVRAIPLGGPLSGRAAAVRITSDVPVTASGAASLGDDVGYTAAAPELRTSGAVVAYNGAGGLASKLLLSAPVKTGTVRITLLGPGGQVGQPRAVRIPAGRTATVELSPDAVRGNFAVVVTPAENSGPVYGARMLSDDLGTKTALTLMSLRTSRTWVEIPAVGASLSVVVGE